MDTMCNNELFAKCELLEEHHIGKSLEEIVKFLNSIVHIPTSQKQFQYFWIQPSFREDVVKTYEYENLLRNHKNMEDNLIVLKEKII